MTSWNIRQVWSDSVSIQSNKVVLRVWFDENNQILDTEKYQRGTFKLLGGRPSKAALAFAKSIYRQRGSV